MEIWLRQDGDAAFVLPVYPSEIKITDPHNNSTVNIINIGDIKLIGKKGLKSCEISSFFPAQAYSFSTQAEDKDPMDYVNRINKWKASGKPIGLVITPLINIEVTIESFTWGLQDATGDIYYSLSLEEYVRIQVVKSEEEAEKPTSDRPTKEPESNKTYTVKTGDCLWKIAKQFYNDGAKWKQIYEANKDKIKDANLIYPQQVLTIP